MWGNTATSLSGCVTRTVLFGCWSRFSLSFTCFSTFAIKDVLKLFLGCSSKPCTLHFICLPWKILSHIVNETVVCEKYKSLSLVKGQRKSVLLLSAFSPTPFNKNVGAREPPLSASMEMKHRRLQLAQTRSCSRALLGFLALQWKRDSSWVLYVPWGTSGGERDECKLWLPIMWTYCIWSPQTVIRYPSPCFSHRKT